MPEILFVWHYVEWGGVQIYFLGIIRQALALGYSVKVVMPENSSEKLLGYLRVENVPVSFFPAKLDCSLSESVWYKIRRRARDARTRFVLARHLEKNGLRGKIVQIDAGAWSDFLLLFYLALKAHVFVTMHMATPFNPKSWRDALTKIKYRFLCGLPKFHLLCSNDDMKQSLRPFLPEKIWQTIPIAYTGVNSTEIQNALAAPLESAELKHKYNLPGDKLLIFSLANIVERKGFRVLIEAAEKLSLNREDLFFVWIGDGEKLAEMQALISKKKLGDVFKIIHPADFGGERSELLQLLRLADVFVHPSFAEGLPGAMLEAMALGKPAVVSRINAVPECITNGENGFLVEAGDVEGFAATISNLANNDALREELGRQAHNRVLASFTEERCARVTIDFYQKCLQTSINRLR
ncbi:MAG: glycosyltransferase family 4 protein [Pyrinomonadaceae bacterium]